MTKVGQNNFLSSDDEDHYDDVVTQDKKLNAITDMCGIKCDEEEEKVVKTNRKLLRGAAGGNKNIIHGKKNKNFVSAGKEMTLPGHVLCEDIFNSGGANGDKKEMKRTISGTSDPKKMLNVPVSGPQHEREMRKVGYVDMQTDMTKWESIVQINRRAETLSFPLHHQPLRTPTITEQLGSGAGAAVGSLEQQVYAMLNGNKGAEGGKKLVEEETLSHAEAVKRRQLMAKERARNSYEEMRNKRQGKIKSKKYRQIQRKIKAKVEEKKQEELQGTGEGDGSLNRALKTRALERASLRHRGGSKWNKQRKQMSKYDEVTRVKVDEQMSKHKELTNRPIIGTAAAVSDDDDEDAVLDRLRKNNLVDTSFIDASSSPWLTNSKPAGETGAASVDQQENLRSWLNTEILSQKEAGDDPKKSAQVFEKAFTTFNAAVSSAASGDSAKNESEKVVTLMKEDENGEVVEVSVAAPVTPAVVTELPNKKRKNEDLKQILNKPAKVIRMSTGDGDDDDDAGENVMDIAAAFNDDDVIAEFNALKDTKTIQEEKLSSSNYMPGWGEWTGEGLLACSKTARKARKRRQKKAKEAAEKMKAKLAAVKVGGVGGVKAKEENQQVWINPERNVNMAKYQVAALPFPFTSAEQFERSISAPITSTWNVPSVHKQIIRPSVTTQVGAIIKPMCPDEANAQNRKSYNAKGKNKKKKKRSAGADSMDGAKI